ncbi:hypothetical protein M407DRAFT_243433 [Tulasnella calospora MUT 4182]|uniref:Uncharacterized protein n=1 Tax=Tulasnella calospora MUT 4182 TaxID=1051891 RepID=A0A0C3M0J2_9AGAM|nr:hypothetical protein M407DRAFT_243433 [Tulasnella calospora MUT 4182]
MEQEADWMNALVGSHRGVWYDPRAEGSSIYLTTFEVPGSKSIARELAGTGRCESHRPELLSLRLASCNGLPESKANRNYFYFDETSGRILIPVHIPYTAFMLMEFA